MRRSIVARILLLSVCASMPFATAHAQRRSSAGGPDKADTTPVTRVVVVPAVERYNASGLGPAIKDLEVIAVYTTDGQVARGLAAKIHANVGGSLIPLARGGRSDEDFTRALIDTIVERTARPNMHRAIVLVAEPELVRPFVRGSLNERGARAFNEDGGLATYILIVRADNMRLVMARPF